MPLHREPLPEELRQKFCHALKAVRERKGISIAQVAATTKIAEFHLVSLERGDLGHWPKGLFRRSFFREYARALGLPVSEACAEFVRLFPEDGAEPLIEAMRAIEAVEQPADVRLTLDGSWHGPRVAILPRLLAAIVDVGVVAVAPIAWGRFSGLDPSLTIAVVSLAYLAIGTVVLGKTPAMWIVSRRWIRDALARIEAALVGWRAKEDEQTQEEAEAPSWISDARRVGAPPESPLRVRFKLQ